MAKKIILLLLALALLSIAQAQPSKKCKTCGKPLKECPYHGTHPDKPNATPATPAATTGALTITSTPTGAAVKVDGKYKGETPLTLERQTPGSYTVVFSSDGYESITRTVKVAAGKTSTCHANMKKKANPQPSPTPNTSRAATSTSTTLSSVETFTANGVSFQMVRVEGGSTGTYYIGETEVTQALWQAVMGSNPSYSKGTNRPVERVSWNDCKEFIRKLNALTGKEFRLPKESEWEYAAKGGNKSHGYTYSGSNDIDDVAWYWKNSGDLYLPGTDDDWNWDKIENNNGRTHPVKQKRANELGIYDMSGNVWEWCEDLYSSSVSYRVYRGGGWYSNAGFCRVSFRSYYDPSTRSFYLGFRLALSAR